MIPVAAVEAALESVFSTSELSRHVWESTVRALLEAAAPHIMAQAWSEGWNAGAGWPQVDDNPYRPAK